MEVNKKRVISRQAQRQVDGVTERQYNLVERHTSPDALLDLVVFHLDEDWIVGFVKPGSDVTASGWPWHTHGDILVHEYAGTPESATRMFVDQVLNSKQVIVLSRVDSVIRNVWVTDDPDADELKHASPNETIEKRFWSGLPYAGG